jgi:hypothetical protein
LRKALAVAVQVQQPAAERAGGLEQRAVERDRHVHGAVLKFGAEAGGVGRLGQHGVQVSGDVRRCYGAAVPGGKRFQQARVQVGLRGGGVAPQGQDVFGAAAGKMIQVRRVC